MKGELIITSQRQLDKTVLNHFIERKDIYLKAKPIPAEHPFIEHIKNRDVNQLRILDIGTGGGPLIYGINTEIPRANCFATDITMDTLRIIKKEGIEFICSSVYSLPFSDNSFDVIVFSDLLHHLVGKTREKSVELVQVAIKEILRVAKKDSTICIIEEFVSYKYQSILLFWLTYSLAKLNLECKFLHINNKVIVSFMTFNELKKLLLSHNIKINFLWIWDVRSWQLKILKFFADLRFVTLIGTTSAEM